MRLVLAFHHHQPLGQLPWVVADAVRDCYAPLLKVLLRHPQIHITLHYSGPLLQMLAADHPYLLEQLKVLLRRGQIELMGGTRWEAILPIWPLPDQLAQLHAGKEQLKVLLDADAPGMWLPERVWEPSLATVLPQAGYRWSMLDSNGLPPTSAQRGWHQNGALTLLSIDATLRQLLPWRPVEEFITYLRDVQQRDSQTIAVFADDAEKFGAWPGTFALVYEEGYLENLLTALEANADWLQTALPSRCLAALPKPNDAEIPSTTYPEMLQWSGGNWRHFLERYPESRDMYEAVLEAPNGSARAAAQCNDAYWHGVFGGLFLPHLRQAVYRKVAQAYQEKPLERTVVETSAEGGNLRNSANLLRINARGGQLSQWIDVASAHNWLATLRHYASDQADWYARGGGIEHFLGDGVTPQQIAAGQFAEEGDFVSEKWEVQCAESGILLTRDGGVWQDGLFRPLLGRKLFLLQEDRWEVQYRWSNPGDVPLRLWWGSEWNFAPSGSAFPERYFQINGEMLSLEETHQRNNVAHWQLQDQWLNRQLQGALQPAGNVWLMPLHTLSRQEGNEMEAIYQQSTFLFHRALHLSPGESSEITLTVRSAEITQINER